MRKSPKTWRNKIARGDYEEQFSDLDRSVEYEQEFEAGPEVKRQAESAEKETPWKREVIGTPRVTFR
jgi:hypothetical protein